jgi:hypothetical protein
MEPMKRLKETISIALCTYNGERFLPRQLASILEQTRLPDEMVVCDDGSTDGTLEILHDFAHQATFPVKVIRNGHTLGSSENFVQAIGLCEGTFIALSDQDDIWYPSRLERSERELNNHPEAALLFSDADLIDEQGGLLGSRLWMSTGFSPRARRQLAAGEYRLCVELRFVTGATVMLRSSFKQTCFPIGEGWIHDEWLGASTSLFGDLRPVSDPLICYRKHSSQQIGPTRQLSLDDKLRLALRMFLHADAATTKHWGHIAATAQRTQVLCDHFAHISLSSQGHARLASYLRFVDYLRFRLSLSPRRLARVLPVFRRRADYARYAGLGSMCKDLLLNHAAVERNLAP